MCPVSTAQRVSCVVRCSRSPPAGLVVAFGLQSVNIFTFVPPHKIIGIVNPPIQVKDKISSKSPGTFPRKFPGRYRGGGLKEEGRPTEEPKSARRGSREAWEHTKAGSKKKRELLHVPAPDGNFHRARFRRDVLSAYSSSRMCRLGMRFGALAPPLWRPCDLLVAKDSLFVTKREAPAR